MENLEKAHNLIGKIKCSDLIEQPDGSWKVTFDYDEKFKTEYKRLFGLKRWSKRHFEKMLDDAIKNFAKQVETDKGLLELRQDLLNMKEDINAD